jgi:hypothetical protein
LARRQITVAVAPMPQAIQGIIASREIAAPKFCAKALERACCVRWRGIAEIAGAQKTNLSRRNNWPSF